MLDARNEATSDQGAAAGHPRVPPMIKKTHSFHRRRGSKTDRNAAGGAIGGPQRWEGNSEELDVLEAQARLLAEQADEVVVGRAASRASVVIAEAIVAGLRSTGGCVVDLGRSPAALARHGLRTQGYRAGVHVRPHRTDPETIEINLFEAPGVQLGAELQGTLVRHVSRQEFSARPTSAT